MRSTMNRRRFPVALVLMLVACVSTQAGKARSGVPTQRDSTEQLLGEWRQARGERAGKAIPHARLSKDHLKFEKDGRVSAGAGDEGTWTTHEARSPKTLDITHTTGPYKGQILCIYEVTDDSLTIVFGLLRGKEVDRPTKFATSKDSPYGLTVYARVRNGEQALPDHDTATIVSIPPNPNDRVIIVSILPDPSTPLAAGSTVTFKATVMYSLASASSGQVGIVIQDQASQNLSLTSPQPTADVLRGKGTITLTDSAAVPATGVSAVLVFFPLTATDGSNSLAAPIVTYTVHKK
jgi:uncharacterized protein (TIGR03067 family)